MNLQLLGPPQVLLDGSPVTGFYSRKGLWVLAVLALRAEREVERSWLAGALWPDADESRGLFYLRRELTSLRHVLGRESVRIQSPTPRSLRLDLEGARVDVLEFDSLSASYHETDLVQAVGLYSGPLLEGCVEEWVEAERAPRQASYLDALEKLSALAVARRDYPTAILRLRTLIGADPLRESAYRDLMRAFAASGDSMAAVQTYRDLVDHLHREMHAEPGPETKEAYRQVRSRAKQAAAQQPRQGLSRIVKIPAPITPLIGRTAEIREIESRFGTSRLVSLIGPGGVGKTRLAIQVAQDMADHLSHGVVFIELASFSDPLLIAPAVAGAIELNECSDSTASEAIQAFFESRQMLLVLDNCEQLVDACARLADALLRMSPHLTILTTSRQALGIMGEATYAVPSLSMPPIGLPASVPLDKGLLSELMEYEATRLFVARARQVRSDFEVTKENGPAIGQICRSLDGIPLAIELAAARLRSLSVQDIAVRLDDRFKLLVGGSRTALPRQQTLRAAIEWSENLLSPTQQAAFRRLAVFAGSWTSDAADAVIGFVPVVQGNVPDLLQDLIDRSLVIRTEVQGQTRFGFLETVRQYALQSLEESGERQEALRRHARYWTEFAEEAERRLTGASAAEQLEALEREHDNLRAALEFCLSESSEGLRCLRLASALTHFWQIRSHFREGSKWIEAALSHPGAQEATTERARALSAGGRLAYRQGRYEQSRIFQNRALAIHRSLGNFADVAFSLNSLGNVANDLGEASAARHCYEEALKVNRQIGNRDQECSNLINLGVLAMRQGDYAAAKPPLVEARASLTEMGGKDGLLFAVSNLANVALSTKEYKEALPLYLEALELSQELGDRRTAAEVIEAIAQISAQTGKEGMIRAARLVGAAAAERERIGSPPHPPDQEQLDELFEFVQRGLGKEATARAHSHGRGMDWHQTLQLAFGQELSTKK